MLPLLNASSPTLTGQTAPAGQWMHYAVQGVAGQALQVNLQRASGDPVLFLKPVGDGTIPGALPTPGDFETYADVGSYVQASDIAWVIRPNVSAAHAAPWGSSAAAGFYASVYANGNAAASFNLQVTQSPCPLGCSGRGTCNPASGTCSCSPSYAGLACGSTLITFGTGSGSSQVTLWADQWVYFAVNIAAGAGSSWDLANGNDPAGIPRLQVRLQHTGNAPVFVAKLNAAPTLSQSPGFDWPVPSGTFTGSAQEVQALQINSTDVTWDLGVAAGDTVYFGLLNYGGRGHTAASSTVTLTTSLTTLGDNSLLGLNPSFMSIVLGIVLSTFLCVTLTLCRRYGVRWLVSRRHNMLWGELPPGMVMGPDGLMLAPRQRPQPPRGLDAAAIAALPESVYSPNANGAGDGDASKEDATCSVCLAEYESGDRLRTLSLCGHVFHRQCIDEWLASHQTCPLCRVSLAPPRSSSGGGQTNADGTAGPERPAETEMAVISSSATEAAAPPASRMTSSGGIGSESRRIPRDVGRPSDGRPLVSRPEDSV
jgi:hypothetical protein